MAEPGGDCGAFGLIAAKNPCRCGFRRSDYAVHLLTLHCDQVPQAQLRPVARPDREAFLQVQTARWWNRTATDGPLANVKVANPGSKGRAADHALRRRRRILCVPVQAHRQVGYVYDQAAKIQQVRGDHGEGQRLCGSGLCAAVDPYSSREGQAWWLGGGETSAAQLFIASHYACSGSLLHSSDLIHLTSPAAFRPCCRNGGETRTWSVGSAIPHRSL